MKILIITDAWTPQINGVVFTLGHTCEELSRMGHHVTLIQPGMFRSFPCPSYPEIRLSLATTRKVSRLIDECAPDAVHVATEGPLGMAARRAMLRRGLPFTTAYHTRFPEYLHARMRVPLSTTYRWLRHFHGAASRTMVPTQSVREDLLSNGFDPEQVVVWARGVDLNVFRTETPTDTQPPLSGKPVFLYAGRVAIEKNLEAFLSLDLPGEKWVIGGGPALEGLKARYPTTRFWGPMSHDTLAQYYRKADVFVFPSLTDTFGLVLLEAMACGCPVAALPARSTQDVLGQSGAGVISNDLRQACMQALSIPRQIPAAYARRFSWQSVTETFYGYLQPIQSSHPTTLPNPRPGIEQAHPHG